MPVPPLVAPVEFRQTSRIRIQNAHLVGIGGAGMRSLAELLYGHRVAVTGSDEHIPEHLFWKLHQQGLRASQGHAASHVPEEADVLIYSPAVPSDNPERREAERRGMRQLSLSQAIGVLMSGRIGVSVAGTHGKSSTTALLGHLLEVAGRSPSVLTGAEVRGRGASGWAGGSQLFIAESCEYRRHFLDLAPRHAVILNIEPDHFDCFRTQQELIDSFAAFASRLPAEGTLLVNYDSPAARDAARGAQCLVRTFGSQAGADWWLGKLRRTKSGWKFDVFHRSKLFGKFTIPPTGRHHVLNALAAIAMGRLFGVDAETITQGLRTFSGVRRRFEHLGCWHGIDVVDDYAHHPTAVRAALRTARDVFGTRRLWCAFQPHQVSRTETLFADFSANLSAADQVLICPVYAAREPASDHQVRLAQKLAASVREAGTPARYLGSLDQITSTIETEARAGDVLLLLGAGDIEQIGLEISRRIQRQRAS